MGEIRISLQILIAACIQPDNPSTMNPPETVMISIRNRKRKSNAGILLLTPLICVITFQSASVAQDNDPGPAQLQFNEPASTPAFGEAELPAPPPPPLAPWDLSAAQARSADMYGSGGYGGAGDMYGGGPMVPPLPPEPFASVSVSRFYPQLQEIEVPGLALDGNFTVLEFLMQLQSTESVGQLNWVIPDDARIRDTRMPVMQFKTVPLSDILDTLNHFAATSPDFNIRFETRSNFILVRFIESPQNPSTRRFIRTFPMAELTRKYELEEILSLLQAAFGTNDDAAFKDSPYRPRYHEQSRILMMNLRQDEYDTARNLIQTLRENARTMSMKEDLQEQQKHQLKQSIRALQAEGDALAQEQRRLEMEMSRAKFDEPDGPKAREMINHINHMKEQINMRKQSLDEMFRIQQRKLLELEYGTDPAE